MAGLKTNSQLLTNSQLKSKQYDTPLTILGSTVKQWCRADLGVTGTSSVTLWSDQSGNGNDYSEATNTPSLETTGFNGKADILFNGTTQKLVNSTLAATLPGGDDTPYYVYIAGQFVTNTAATPVIFGCGRTTATPPSVDFFYNNTGTMWQMNKRGDDNALKAISGGTRDTSRHCFQFFNTGTTGSIIVDSTIVVNGASQNAGITTLNRMSLGCLILNNVAQFFCNCRIAEVVVANAVPTETQRNAILAYYNSRYV